jgi:lysyl-tRNA synthetase class 2
VDPFPRTFPDRVSVAAVEAACPAAGVGEHSDLRYRVAGRLVGRRSHGKTTFMELRDVTGRIQLYARLDALGEGSYEDLLRLDIGDIVGVVGCVYVTRRGELSLKVEGWVLLAKSLRPPPEGYHGVGDVEVRSRHREVDLMANEASRELFITRARVIAAVRSWLNDHGFVEVETPTLQPLYGGASARPFVTHHNALDERRYLRISPELYLKRCVVGGLEKVYDLGKCFRNEGISPAHNPEFTLLEWIESFTDYTGAMSVTERMVAEVAERVLGTTRIRCNGEDIDLAPPWRRLRCRDAIKAVTGIDILACDRSELLAALGPAGNVEVDQADLVGAVFSKYVEPSLIQPTFVTDFPEGWVVTVKRHLDEPDLAECFDAFVGGMELATGGTELNDPDEQRKHFFERRPGSFDGADDGCDDDYIRALEYGMPPAGGAGIGIDRLVMMLAGRASVREVVLFPAMRTAKSLAR